MKLYSSIKKNEIIRYFRYMGRTGKPLLKEVTQTQKQKPCMFSLIS